MFIMTYDQEPKASVLTTSLLGMGPVFPACRVQYATKALVQGVIFVVFIHCPTLRLFISSIVWFAHHQTTLLCVSTSIYTLHLLIEHLRLSLYFAPSHQTVWYANPIHGSSSWFCSLPSLCTGFTIISATCVSTNHKQLAMVCLK